jgi:RNA polymerase sigma-70 factor (ECF subfamily)
MHLVSAAVVEKWNVLSDAEVVAHVVAGRTALFELLMHRHNERVYRTCRAVVADDERAEALVVDAFLDAYASLRRFDGTTPFAIWLTRIALRSAARFGRRPFVVESHETGQSKRGPIGMSAAAAAERGERSDDESAVTGHHVEGLLTERTGATAPDAFRFDRPRCDRVVSTVLSRIASGTRV